MIKILLALIGDILFYSFMTWLIAVAIWKINPVAGEITMFALAGLVGFSLAYVYNKIFKMRGYLK